MAIEWGKTLLIANPVAQSGKGAVAAERAEEILKPILGEKLSVVYTKAQRHGVEIAANAADYDTIIALGGDGVIHETANGLMQISPELRPRMAIIPYGSGNDYARTLSIPASDVDAALNALFEAEEHSVDVGNCNGEYFLETLSFGLDAGIALATMELRKHTTKKDTPLYFEAGIDQLLHHLDTYVFEADIDGRKVSDKCIMFAVQIGVTYGAGFRICPRADIEDGLFDMCYSNPANVVKSIYVFSKAKTGKHVKYPQVHFDRGSSIKIKFDHRPPCQIDGEELIADEYVISMNRQALRVLKGVR